MPKPPNPELRYRIAELVLQQVNTHGVESISMRNLAKELKITATTLYYYFDSKEKLIGLAHNTATNKLFDFIQVEVNKKSKPRKRIEKFITSFIDWGISNPNLFQLIFDTHNEIQSVDDIESNYRIFLFALEIIFDGIEEKDFEVVNPDISVNILLSSLYGIVRLYQDNHRAGKQDKGIEAIKAECAQIFINQYFRKKKK